jgi:phosphatidylglycerol:prolipoprotein diacylglycerol transferase
VAALTYPDLDPVAFALGRVEVHWYGMAYLAGFLFAIWVFWELNRRWRVGLSIEQVADVLLAAVASILLGGRLGYVLFYNLGYYLDDPVRIVAVWDGGMSFHGALAAILAAAWWMSRRLDVPFLRLVDMGAVGAPMGIFFGRLANFVNGELWGRASDVPWAMVFPGAGEAARHPSQLYEAAGEGLLIFIVLWMLSRRKRADGTYIGVFLIMYGVARFLIEYVREPDPQLGLILGPLSMGQLLTLPMIGAGAWLLWRAVRARGGNEIDPCDTGGTQQATERP